MFWLLFFLLTLTVLATGNFFIRSDSSLTNANYLAICDAMALIFIFCGYGKKIKYYEIVSVIVLATFCILSGTRKALLTVFIGILIILLMIQNIIIMKIIIIIQFY